MKFQTIIIAVNLVIVMGIANFGIWGKEKTLAEGDLVLLRLRPRDPRSLMQGDFMRLAYRITDDWSTYDENVPVRGYAIVQQDNFGVADTLLRFQEEAQPLATGEYAIKYYHSSGFVSIGAESFFFQEGTAEKYEEAWYGGLRVAPDGESVLVGLYDENRALIE